MKNRRTVIIAFLMIAAVAFGTVGYAALTDQFTINGSANISKAAAQISFDELVYFSSAVANDPAEGKNSASVVADEPDVAGFSANGLSTAGDSTTFTFTITNDSDLDAVVTPTPLSAASNNKPEFFHLVSDWNGQAKTIPAKTSMTYTLTVSVLETPQEELDAAFQIILSVSSVDAA